MTDSPNPVQPNTAAQVSSKEERLKQERRMDAIAVLIGAAMTLLIATLAMMLARMSGLAAALSLPGPKVDETPFTLTCAAAAGFMAVMTLIAFAFTMYLFQFYIEMHLEDS